MCLLLLIKKRTLHPEVCLFALGHTAYIPVLLQGEIPCCLGEYGTHQQGVIPDPASHPLPSNLSECGCNDTKNATLHAKPLNVFSNGCDSGFSLPPPPYFPEEKLSLDMPSEFILEGITLSTQSLGVGSYGSVVRASYHSTPVAAKSMHPILQQSLRYSWQHGNEIETLSKIRHPNIVQFIGTHRDENGSLFLIMEHVEGGSVSELVGFLQAGKRKVSLNQKMGIFIGIGRALEYLHSIPLVHRDLSSSNVLLTKELQVKVSDFGMCWPFVPSQPSTLAPGCYLYMPPEALKPNGVFTEKGDIFSFSIIIMELINQAQPRVLNLEHEYDKRMQDVRDFESRAPPRELHGLVMDCLQDDPEKRPSAKDINSELKDLLKSLPEEKDVLTPQSPNLSSREPHQESGLWQALSPFVSIEGPIVCSPPPHCECEDLEDESIVDREQSDLDYTRSLVLEQPMITETSQTPMEKSEMVSGGIATCFETKVMIQNYDTMASQAGACNPSGDLHDSSEKLRHTALNLENDPSSTPPTISQQHILVCGSLPHEINEARGRSTDSVSERICDADKASSTPHQDTAQKTQPQKPEAQHDPHTEIMLKYLSDLVVLSTSALLDPCSSTCTYSLYWRKCWYTVILARFIISCGCIDVVLILGGNMILFFVRITLFRAIIEVQSSQQNTQLATNAVVAFGSYRHTHSAACLVSNCFCRQHANIGPCPPSLLNISTNSGHCVYTVFLSRTILPCGYLDIVVILKGNTVVLFALRIMFVERITLVESPQLKELQTSQWIVPTTVKAGVVHIQRPVYSAVYLLIYRMLTRAFHSAMSQHSTTAVHNHAFLTETKTPLVHSPSLSLMSPLAPCSDSHSHVYSAICAFMLSKVFYTFNAVSHCAVLTPALTVSSSTSAVVIRPSLTVAPFSCKYIPSNEYLYMVICGCFDMAIEGCFRIYTKLIGVVEFPKVRQMSNYPAALSPNSYSEIHSAAYTFIFHMIYSVCLCFSNAVTSRCGTTMLSSPASAFLPLLPMVESSTVVKTSSHSSCVHSRPHYTSIALLCREVYVSLDEAKNAVVTHIALVAMINVIECLQLSTVTLKNIVSGTSALKCMYPAVHTHTFNMVSHVLRCAPSSQNETSPLLPLQLYSSSPVMVNSPTRNVPRFYSHSSLSILKGDYLVILKQSCVAVDTGVMLQGNAMVTRIALVTQLKMFQLKAMNSSLTHSHDSQWPMYSEVHTRIFNTATYAIRCFSGASSSQNDAIALPSPPLSYNHDNLSISKGDYCILRQSCECMAVLRSNNTMANHIALVTMLKSSRLKAIPLNITPATNQRCMYSEVHTRIFNTATHVFRFVCNGPLSQHETNAIPRPAPTLQPYSPCISTHNNRETTTSNGPSSYNHNSWIVSSNDYCIPCGYINRVVVPPGKGVVLHNSLLIRLTSVVAFIQSTSRWIISATTKATGALCSHKLRHVVDAYIFRLFCHNFYSSKTESLVAIALYNCASISPTQLPPGVQYPSAVNRLLPYSSSYTNKTGCCISATSQAMKIHQDTPVIKGFIFSSFLDLHSRSLLVYATSPDSVYGQCNRVKHPSNSHIPAPPSRKGIVLTNPLRPAPYCTPALTTVEHPPCVEYAVLPKLSNADFKDASTARERSCALSLVRNGAKCVEMRLLPSTQETVDFKIRLQVHAICLIPQEMQRATSQNKAHPMSASITLVYNNVNDDRLLQISPQFPTIPILNPAMLVILMKVFEPFLMGKMVSYETRSGVVTCKHYTGTVARRNIVAVWLLTHESTPKPRLRQRWFTCSWSVHFSGSSYPAIFGTLKIKSDTISEYLSMTPYCHKPVSSWVHQCTNSEPEPNTKTSDGLSSRLLQLGNGKASPSSGCASSDHRACVPEFYLHILLDGRAGAPCKLACSVLNHISHITSPRSAVSKLSFLTSEVQTTLCSLSQWPQALLGQIQGRVCSIQASNSTLSFSVQRSRRENKHDDGCTKQQEERVRIHNSCESGDSTVWRNQQGRGPTRKPSRRKKQRKSNSAWCKTQTIWADLLYQRTFWHYFFLQLYTRGKERVAFHLYGRGESRIKKYACYAKPSTSSRSLGTTKLSPNHLPSPTPFGATLPPTQLSIPNAGGWVSRPVLIYMHQCAWKLLPAAGSECPLTNLQTVISQLPHLGASRTRPGGWVSRPVLLYMHQVVECAWKLLSAARSESPLTSLHTVISQLPHLGASRTRPGGWVSRPVLLYMHQVVECAWKLLSAARSESPLTSLHTVISLLPTSRTRPECLPLDLNQPVRVASSPESGDSTTTTTTGGGSGGGDGKGKDTPGRGSNDKPNGGAGHSSPGGGGKRDDDENDDKKNHRGAKDAESEDENDDMGEEGEQEVSRTEQKGSITTTTGESTEKECMPVCVATDNNIYATQRAGGKILTSSDSPKQHGLQLKKKTLQSHSNITVPVQVKVSVLPDSSTTSLVSDKAKGNKTESPIEDQEPDKDETASLVNDEAKGNQTEAPIEDQEPDKYETASLVNDEAKGNQTESPIEDQEPNKNETASLVSDEAKGNQTESPIKDQEPDKNETASLVSDEAKGNKTESPIEDQEPDKYETASLVSDEAKGNETESSIEDQEPDKNETASLVNDDAKGNKSSTGIESIPATEKHHDEDEFDSNSLPANNEAHKSNTWGLQSPIKSFVDNAEEPVGNPANENHTYPSPTLASGAQTEESDQREHSVISCDPTQVQEGEYNATSADLQSTAADIWQWYRKVANDDTHLSEDSNSPYPLLESASHNTSAVVTYNGLFRCWYPQPASIPLFHLPRITRERRTSSSSDKSYEGPSTPGDDEESCKKKESTQCDSSEGDERTDDHRGEAVEESYYDPLGPRAPRQPHDQGSSEEVNEEDDSTPSLVVLPFNAVVTFNSTTATQCILTQEDIERESENPPDQGSYARMPSFAEADVVEQEVTPDFDIMAPTEESPFLVSLLHTHSLFWASNVQLLCMHINRRINSPENHLINT